MRPRTWIFNSVNGFWGKNLWNVFLVPWNPRSLTDSVNYSVPIPSECNNVYVYPCKSKLPWSYRRSSRSTGALSCWSIDLWSWEACCWNRFLNYLGKEVCQGCLTIVVTNKQKFNGISWSVLFECIAIKIVLNSRFKVLQYDIPYSWDFDNIPF